MTNIRKVPYEQDYIFKWMRLCRKTSIARSIQHLSKDSWLTFSVDSFISMMPCSYDDKASTEYLTFVPGSNDRGPTMRVESGSKAEQLFGVMPDFVNLLASRGNNIIIDEVLFDDSCLKSYIKILSGYSLIKENGDKRKKI
jgi:chloramphenicol 3-O-phosphotransferase